jgi:hypothetical protein
MIKESSIIDGREVAPRGWDALEIRLKSRSLSCSEIQEARKSFFDGIETLSKMFLAIYAAEKKSSDGNKSLV